MRADSAAHAAGLRDGQELRGWSVHGGDVDEEIELRVEDEGEARTIRYLPRGEELEVPLYSLKQEEGE